MAYVSKIFRSFKHCQYNGGGGVAMFHLNEKSLSASSFSILELIKSSPEVKKEHKPSNNDIFFTKNFFKYDNNNKSSNKKKYFEKKFFIPSKFSKLNLQLIIQNADHLKEGAVLSLFHKMLSIYNAHKNDVNFLKDLEVFSRSTEFNQFCKILQNNLPLLPPNVLVHFLHLYHFKVHVKNPVMQRLLSLIYENINCFLLSEILEIYVILKKSYFDKSKICEDILRECDCYFQNSFEDELSHIKDPYELVLYLHEEVLPLSVKKLLAEKYFDFMERKNFRSSLYIHLFKALVEEPLASLYKPKVCEHLKNTIDLLATGLTVRSLSDIYQKGVSKNDSIYDEEVCNAIAKQISKPKINFHSALSAIESLCLMGYFNYDLINYVANNVLTEVCPPETALKIASVFARTSFHEKNHNDWDAIKHRLEEFNTVENFTNMSDLVKWCEYLTFLGCDTKNLLSHIFKTISRQENDLLTASDDSTLHRDILRLHHFARVNVSTGYEQLLNRTICSCIEKAKFKNKFLQQLCLTEVLGSEDFYLKNCITSSQNLISAVMVLGPDNKPINLSSYKIQDTNNKSIESHYRKFQIYNNMENIKKPPGSKIIAFECFFDCQPCEFRNAPIKSGVYQIFLKSIQDVQSNVVVVENRFFYKTFEERLQFIKSKINEIIENREAEGNNIRI